LKDKRPAEILTQANRILGTGQLSLAKYLFIAADDGNGLDCQDVPAFFSFVFERVDFARDLHFHTRTTIDTLDYSGEGINEGSKLVVAATGEKIRDLKTSLPVSLGESPLISKPEYIMPGVIAVQLPAFTSYTATKEEIDTISVLVSSHKDDFEGIVQLVLYDDFNFTNKLNDYLWVTYTRSNPSHDIYGVGEKITHKHWGCEGPMIIDARKKPHHAPELRTDGATEKAIAKFF
jgi:4-hydroxy-3-polyprenylbenzoate decarboxylase